MQTEVAAASEPLSPSPGAAFFSGDNVLDPSKVREAVAMLVAADQIDMAAEMADLALAIYPDSDHVLSISALVAEVKQNWPEAHQILVRLEEVQGSNLQPSTIEHRIRVLRCMGEIERARLLCDQALRQFPTHTALSEELLALKALAS